MTGTGSLEGGRSLVAVESVGRWTRESSEERICSLCSALSPFLCLLVCLMACLLPRCCLSVFLCHLSSSRSCFCCPACRFVERGILAVLYVPVSSVFSCLSLFSSYGFASRVHRVKVAASFSSRTQHKLLSMCRMGKDGRKEEKARTKEKEGRKNVNIVVLLCISQLFPLLPSVSLQLLLFSVRCLSFDLVRGHFFSLLLFVIFCLFYSYLVQRYISSPLLIGGYKFDMRNVCRQEVEYPRR